MTRQAKPESLSPEEARLVKLELQEFEEGDWYSRWGFYCLDLREMESRFSPKEWPPETELTRWMDTDSFEGELWATYFQFKGLITERYRKTFKIVSDVGRRNPCWGEPKFTRKVVWRYLRRIKPDIEKAFYGWFGGKFPFTSSIKASVKDVNSELRKIEKRWLKKKFRTHIQKVASQPAFSGMQHARDKVDAFMAKMAEVGYKIKRKDIWVAAGYTDARGFERFQNGASRVTKTSIINFNRVLSMTPESFIAILEKKKQPTK